MSNQLRLLDTIVLIGAINPNDALHEDASRHLNSVTRDSETFLPFISAIEFDLVMKGRRYTSKEREDALDWLSYAVPSSKVVCNSVLSLRKAAKLQDKGVGYFDSMIAALALAMDAVVLTKDRVISEVAKTSW